MYALGAHVTGQMDDLVNMKEICTKYGIWLHISGDNLSGLALAKSKTEVCLFIYYIYCKNINVNNKLCCHTNSIIVF